MGYLENRKEFLIHLAAAPFIKTFRYTILLFLLLTQSGLTDLGQIHPMTC